MNDQVYQFGIRLIGILQGIPWVAGPLTGISRIWLRHHKIRQFLQTQSFDGVIDGGANVGEFASIVRSALPQAHLICVEPHAASAAILRKQGFQVIEGALWNEKGRLNLSQPNSATTSCTVMPSDDSQSLGHWEVDAIRLEDLPVKGQKIFVKLDLQGAEIPALQGMGRLWERCAAVMLEVSIGGSGNCETLRLLLAQKGFYEYATVNELESDGHVIEADKIWLRQASET